MGKVGGLHDVTPYASIMGDDDLIRWLMLGRSEMQLPQWPRWMLDAGCLEHDPALFFPSMGRTGEAAKRVCDGCLVRDECLSWALDDEGDDPGHLRHGVWGGMTPRERADLAHRRRMRPAA